MTGKIKAVSGTLTADTVGTVTINTLENINSLAVHIDAGSTSPIFYRIDGGDPVVDGDNCLKLQAVGDHIRTLKVPATNSLEVRLISAGNTGYRIEAW